MAINGFRRCPRLVKRPTWGLESCGNRWPLRESLGLIDAAPRRGIETLGYDFLPAVKASLEAGMALDESCFLEFADLRMSLESSFWDDAVASMTELEMDQLGDLCRVAYAKLNGTPTEIPREEHREFHLTIFRNLGNPFVLALLTAYWDVYQRVAPKFYEDLAHLRENLDATYRNLWSP